MIITDEALGRPEMTPTKPKLEKRAEFLAEKYGLSLQLTAIWLEQHPNDLRPNRPAALADLIQWARVR